MKCFLSIALLWALLLSLEACAAPKADSSPQSTPAPEITAEPTPTPASPGMTPWPDVHVKLTDLDLSSYQGELSPEDWEALEGFFPVLNNEVPMLAAHLATTVTPTQEVFFQDIYSAYAPDSEIPPDYHEVMAFALTPVTGGNLDLVFSLDSLGGWYLLIHREGEQFYAVYMPVRWFMELQTDGLYYGSGGAARAYYNRLSFAGGTFTADLLANTDWGEYDEEGVYHGYFAIGGREVSEEEFELWREESLTGPALWYPAREKASQ